MLDRYCRLFDIVPGQYIHLGKNLPDVWKHQLQSFHVSTGAKTLPCDLLIETNISKSLNLVEKGGLDKLIMQNGSALLQVSKAPWRHFRRIKNLITKHINQINNSGIRVTLPDDAGSLHYFVLSIKPRLENPNDISMLPCTVNGGELYIARESANFSGSIAVLATTRETPFSHLLSPSSDNTITVTSSSITRVMFRDRGTLIVEIKDADNNQYISRSSLTAECEKNIAKNYKIIESLLANPAISQDAKRLIPKPVARSFNASIEVKKPGQLAWKIVRDNPDLEPLIITQAWDFSLSLCIGTCRPVKIDNEGFDAIVGSDLKYIQQFCRDDNEVTRLLGLINEYLLKRLFGNEIFVVFSHGDFGYGNILYDNKTASLSGVIDWDTSRDVELPGVDFINLLIQKFRAHSRMDKSYKAALRWLTSEQPLPTKIRGQLHERFGITGKNLKLYSLVSVLHLMGRDFRFREAGSLSSEERHTLILIASSIEQPCT